MEKIRNNLPIMSASLIFIGYLNYHFFYTHFDIEIESYLTTTELIFSFLPLTIPFLIVLTLLLFWILAMHLTIGQKDKELERQDKELNDNSTILEDIVNTSMAWPDLVRYFKRSKNGFVFWIGVPFSILLFLMRIGVQIFLVVYIFIFIINVVELKTFEIFELGFFLTLIFGIFWIVFLSIKIDMYKKEETKNPAKMVTKLLILPIAIGLLKLANQEDARKILDGKPKYSIKIDFNDNSNIDSDSTVVYIGQTANFIFLRDLRNSENRVFKMDNIKDFRLTKLTDDNE